MTGSTGGAAASSVTATNASDYYAGGDAHWSGLLTYQGSPLIATDGNGYPNTLQFNGTNGSLDFNVSSSSGSIAVWSFQFNGAISLYVDGTVASRVPLASGTVYAETLFSTGTGAHSYRVVETGTGTGFPFVEAFRCPSCSFATQPAVRPIISVCGASIVDVSGGGSATSNGDQTNWGLLQSVGFTDQGSSASGQTLYTYLRDHCPGEMATGGGATPLIGWMEPDPNDIVADNSLANVQAAAQTVVTNILANATPPAILYVSGYYSATYDNSGVCTGLSAPQCAALYNSAIAAGVAAVGSAKTVFIHTQSLTSGAPDWINSNSACTGTNDTQEGVHPCAATSIGAPGFGKIANRQAPLFLGQTLGSSFSVSGPTTGVQYSVSSPFTSTIGGSASGVTWMDIVTVHSSVSSDQICIVGGSCGTGSVATPGGLGASAFQYTIDAVVTGAHTISYTSLPDGWVAPANTAITITPAPVVGTYFLIGSSASPERRARPPL
jgi:hypothetical protein